VNLRDGSNPNEHQFEGTHRPYGMVMASVNHVTVHNLTFEHAQKSCVLATAYSDSTAGGSYFTNEYNVISDNSCWNYGDLVADNYTLQSHYNSLEGGYVVRPDGSYDPHHLRGNLVTGNDYGTMDAYYGVRGAVLKSGIFMVNIDGGGTADDIVASYNVGRTVNTPCFTYNEEQVYAHSGHTLLNEGGRVAYNTCSNSQGNFFFTSVAGGRIDHNIAKYSFGEGIQLGGGSTSTLSVPQSVDHNVLADLGQDADMAGFNGIDCNGGVDGVFETNNTIFNTNSAGFTLEDGCTGAHVHNTLVDQNAPPWPSTETSLNNSYLIYYLGASKTANVDFSHNIWVNGSNRTPFHSPTGSLTCTDFVAAWPDASSSCVDDALFKNATGGDFSLQFGSPAIGKGIVGHIPNATPDVGAIPYGSLKLF
jgi:hypothetical protein